MSSPSGSVKQAQTILTEKTMNREDFILLQVMFWRNARPISCSIDANELRPQAGPERPTQSELYYPQPYVQLVIGSLNNVYCIIICTHQIRRTLTDIPGFLIKAFLARQPSGSSDWLFQCDFFTGIAEIEKRLENTKISMDIR